MSTPVNGSDVGPFVAGTAVGTAVDTSPVGVTLVAATEPAGGDEAAAADGGSVAPVGPLATASVVDVVVEVGAGVGVGVGRLVGVGVG